MSTPDITFDRTAIREAIEQIEHTPNATYQEAPSTKELFGLDIVQGFSFAVEEDVPVSFDGPPGIGKTAFLNQVCRQLGIQVEVINLGQITPDNLVLPAKHEREGLDFPYLDFTLDGRLASPDPKVIVLDDKSRGSKHVQNMALELVQSRAIQGIEIPNLLAVLGTDNQGKAEGISSEPDLAAKDRWVTVQVDSTSTPWRRALAAKYADVDLTGAFNVYKTLTPDIRWFFSPRKLDHLLYNLLRGNPGEWSVSVVSGERRWWGSEDRTFEIIEKVASAIGVANRQKVSEPVKVALDAAIADGSNVYIESPPGSGKTAYVTDYLGKQGIDVIALSGPTMMPEDLVFPAVEDGKVVRMPNGRFVEDTGRRKMLLLDEVWRASAPTRNAFMPVLQERSFGGVVPDDFVGTIACNNPKKVGEMRLDVGRPDPAQADRFPISLQINHDDLPGLEWLLATYGTDAEPIVEWYQEDLPPMDPSRVLITRRTLERLIKLARRSLPLEWALITSDGERIPVSLADLKSRLSNRPLARLKAIVADVDSYEEILSKGEDHDPAAHHAVYEAFSRAMLPQLEEVRDVCVTLYRHLNRQHRLNLVRHGGVKQAFWHSVLMDATKAA